MLLAVPFTVTTMLPLPMVAPLGTCTVRGLADMTVIAAPFKATEGVEPKFVPVITRPICAGPSDKDNWVITGPEPPAVLTLVQPEALET